MHTLWEEHRRNVRLHSATAKLAMMILVWWHCPLLLHHVTVQWLPPFVTVHMMAAEHSRWAITHTRHVCRNADILTVQCFWDIFTFPFLKATETVSERAQRHGCQVAIGNHFVPGLWVLSMEAPFLNYKNRNNKQQNMLPNIKKVEHAPLLYCNVFFLGDYSDQPQISLANIKGFHA